MIELWGIKLSDKWPFSLCGLSLTYGKSAVTFAVSSLICIALFVPQAWNYKQHGCLFTHCVACPTGVEQHCCLFTHLHCVICPTGLELQAASLSLHSLCYLSHKCGTTSSTAVSSRIVLFVPQVWNYKQRRCLFTLLGHLDYIRTTFFHHVSLLQSLLEYFSSLTCLHALCVFVFSLNCLLWSFIFLVCLSVLFSSVFFFLCCLFASKLALVYGSQYYANESDVKADSEQNLCFILFLSLFSHSFGLLFFLIFHLLLASSSLKFLGFLYQFITVDHYQCMKRTLDHSISV